MNDLPELLASIFLATKKPRTTPSLKKAVNAFLRTKPADQRRPGVHVTDLVDPCIRKIAWKIIKPEIADPAPDTDAARFFGQGHVSHDWWQNEVYGPAKMLLGSWQCGACKTIVSGKTTMPEYVCPKCENSAWKYMEPEVNIIIAGIPVTGNGDGCLLWQNKEHLLELKTMQTEEWKSVKLPPPKFVLQGSIYAPALGLDSICVSIIAKDSWDTKDFFVPVMPTALPWAESIMKTAKSVTSNPLKGARACKNAGVARAGRCGCRNMCFPN